MVSNPSGAPETRQTTVGCPFGPTESFCPGNIRWAEFALSLLIFFFASAFPSLGGRLGWYIQEEKHSCEGVVAKYQCAEEKVPTPKRLRSEVCPLPFLDA